MAAWRDRARVLLGETQVTAEIANAMSWSVAAFESSAGFQVSWKSSVEVAVEELCERLAPEHVMTVARSGEALIVRIHDPEGVETDSVTLETIDELSHAEALDRTARLAGGRALPLNLLNDGDDLHFVLLDAQHAERVVASLAEHGHIVTT